MSDVLLEKWDAVLNSEKVESISDSYKKRVTAQLLENQEKSLMETAGNVDANIATYDPVLISLVRRMAPKLIAYEFCGVQPLTMPTGLVFCLKARYTDRNGAEAMGINEVNSAFSGTGTHSSSDADWSTMTYGTGIATGTAETASMAAMALTIEKVTVSVKTRQLRADYSLELSQDLKAVHGLDADNELTNILSNEITNEINREIVRSVYGIAKAGAQWAGITSAGTFSLVTDSDGRYFVEKLKSLYFAIQRDANKIALETRRGKGNFVILSPDVASGLALCGSLNYAPAFDSMIKLDVDPAGVTYVGMLGDLKAYIDPYATFDFYVVGYKGATAYDAGFFYAPYVPLQLYRATDPVTMQPALAFKTRYGVVENPFVHTTNSTLVANSNQYFRKVKVTGIQDT